MAHYCRCFFSLLLRKWQGRRKCITESGTNRVVRSLGTDTMKAGILVLLCTLFVVSVVGSPVQPAPSPLFKKIGFHPYPPCLNTVVCCKGPTGRIFIAYTTCGCRGEGFTIVSGSQYNCPYPFSLV